MASLAANASADHSPRVRYRAPTLACADDLAQPLCLFSARGSCSFRDRTDQRRFAVASGLQPTGKSEAVDLWLKESVPVSAFCPFHLSPRGSDHSRFLSHLCGVRCTPRKTLLSPGEWCRPLTVFRCHPQSGAWR